MKVSEIIKRLQELQEEYGNVECQILYEDGIRNIDSGIDDINEIDMSFEIDGTNPAIYIAHRDIESKEE